MDQEIRSILGDTGPQVAAIAEPKREPGKMSMLFVLAQGLGWRPAGSRPAGSMPRARRCQARTDVGSTTMTCHEKSVRPDGARWVAVPRRIARKLRSH